LHDIAAQVSACTHASQYAVVTDSQVEPLHGEQVRSALAESGSTTLISFPAGEWNKSRECWSTLTDQLLHHGCDRDTVLVALGGGVTGDLVGFVAATILRGVDYLFAPTTLTAMVERVVSDETGVDTAFGRDLVGAHHPPCAVVADVHTLISLPPVHIAAGVAGALKHGAVADAEYFGRVLEWRDAVRAKDPAVLAKLVRRSVEIKSAILAGQIPRHPTPAALGFGRTVALGLQALLGYELLHGEALAIGMIVEATIGERIGVTNPGVANAMTDAAAAFRLPSELPQGLDIDRLLEAMQGRGARRDKAVRFALLSRIGSVAPASEEDGMFRVPESELRDLLAAVS
jgi:3-dehydroquinate synthase